MYWNFHLRNIAQHLKRNELLKNTTVWMNLKGIMLSETTLKKLYSI